MVEIVISLLSVLGASGILMFFIKRYFDRRDAKENKKNQESEKMLTEIKNISKRTTTVIKQVSP